jgi:maleate isomerase
MVYGWRGKVGLIFPAPGTAPEVEFHRKVPEGVAVLTTRVPIEEVTPKGLIKMGSYVAEAASLLAAAKPDLIVFACTTGSLIKGVGYDKEIIDNIQRRTGIPATTTTTAVIEGLNFLKLKRLAITTPYSDEVNQAEKAFLQNSGFEVISIKGLGLVDPLKMPQVRHDEIYGLVKEGFNEEADGIFVSCTGIGVIDLIETLEEDFKKPVITSNQSTLWAALRRINVGKPIEGLGRLFRGGRI